MPPWPCTFIACHERWGYACLTLRSPRAGEDQRKGHPRRSSTCQIADMVVLSQQILDAISALRPLPPMRC